MTAKTSQSRALTPEELQQFGAEIDALRDRVRADLGERDVRYMRNVIRLQRWMEVAGRAILVSSGWFPPLWLLGTLLLGMSKIIENMEIGHNIIHGQFDWTGDPRMQGKTYEWDIVGTADNWRKTHNFRHHTYTNIHGMDDDVGGYGVLRLFPEQKWHPANLFQPIYAVIFALLFQWGVAIQDLRIGRYFLGKISGKALYRQSKPTLKKAGRQLVKDYVIFPLLAGPFFLPVFLGNLVANGTLTVTDTDAGLARTLHAVVTRVHVHVARQLGRQLLAEVHARHSRADTERQADVRHAVIGDRAARVATRVLAVQVAVGLRLGDGVRPRPEVREGVRPVGERRRRPRNR